MAKAKVKVEQRKPVKLAYIEHTGAYDDIPFRVVTQTAGDVFARTLVRIGEMAESVGIVRRSLLDLPGGPLKVTSPRVAPRAEILSRYEAPRGELVHFIRTNNTDKVERLDVRTPTLANWTSVVWSLRGHPLADLPVVVAAIDPCLSCTSRIAIARPDGTGTTSMTWDELRDHGKRYYRATEGL